MRTPRLSPLLLRTGRPPFRWGLLAAALAVVLETLLIYPLAHVSDVSTLGVVYLVGVVAVSTWWGIGLGLATAIVSATAFNLFHLPPVGHLTLAASRGWVDLAALVVVAATTGVIAELARTRAAEAERRRREADLGAELARVLLGNADLEDALATAARRLAAAIGATSAAIELRPVPGDDRRTAFPLRHGEEVIGTLVLPSQLGTDERERVAARIVPALQSVLAAALTRARLQAEVVETTALRRNDEMKTALLRSVSHDLRTPLTAILSAAASLDPARSDAEELAEARDVVLESAHRLATLVEKLLDLSRLQSGAADRHPSEYSLEEVLTEAIEHVAGDRSLLRLSLDGDLPLLVGDPAQLERAFANLLENAVRYAGGKPVLIRARVAGGHVRLRIIDQGPGIRPEDLERIFLPFYRSPGQAQGHLGSGLGLAIAKGFIEANGGRISVESLPGQGSAFDVELPLEPVAAAA